MIDDIRAIIQTGLPGWTEGHRPSTSGPTWTWRLPDHTASITVSEVWPDPDDIDDGGWQISMWASPDSQVHPVLAGRRITGLTARIESPADVAALLAGIGLLPATAGPASYASAWEDGYAAGAAASHPAGCAEIEAHRDELAAAYGDLEERHVLLRSDRDRLAADLARATDIIRTAIAVLRDGTAAGQAAVVAAITPPEYRREDPEPTGQPVPAGVDGVPCGRRVPWTPEYTDARTELVAHIERDGGAA